MEFVWLCLRRDLDESLHVLVLRADCSSVVILAYLLGTDFDTFLALEYSLHSACNENSSLFSIPHSKLTVVLMHEIPSTRLALLLHATNAGPVTSGCGDSTGLYHHFRPHIPIHRVVYVHIAP